MKTKLTIAIALSFATTALADQAKPAPDAKKAPEPAKKDDAAAKKAPEAPKKLEAPKPPKEVEEMSKMMTGNWKCTGKGAIDPSDASKTAEMTGTMTAKLDLDKFWVKSEWTGKSQGVTMKGQMFTTYDAGQKKWFRYMMDSTGGSEWATSTGLTGTKIVWDGEMRGMGMPAGIKTRSTEDVQAKEVKMVSEASMDGKKYIQVFEMTCKK